MVCLNLIDHWDRSVTKIALRSHALNGFDRYLELAEGREDITVEEISFPEGADFQEWLQKKKVPLGIGKWLRRLFGPIMIAWSSLSFARRFRRVRPAAVISNSGAYPGGPLNIAAIVGACLAGVPRRIFLSNGFATKSPSPFRFYDFMMDKLVASASTNIVTVSQTCAQQIARTRSLHHPIQVIPNGIAVDTSKDHSPDEARAVLQVSPEDLVIGVLGHLEEHKGQEIAVRALPPILKAEPRARLVLVGWEEPEYAANVRALSRDLGVEQAVNFIGFVPHAERLLSGVDLLTVPSVRLESFGLVVLEAMARHKPVIVSDTGALSEIIEDGKTGLVFPSGDAEALADQAIRLLQDCVLRRRLTEAAFAELQAKFTVARMIEDYQDLLKP